MAEVWKGCIALVFAALLAGVSFWLGGEGYDSLTVFLDGGVHAISAWVGVVACAVVLKVLGCWLRFWVAPVLLLGLGALVFGVLRTVGLLMPESLLCVAMYSVLASSAIWFAKRPFSFLFGNKLVMPGLVCFLLPVILEAVSLGVVWPSNNAANLIGFGVGVGCGALVAIVTCLLPRSAARIFLLNDGSTVETRVVEGSVESTAVANDVDSLVFPVGASPAVSVLDSKLSKMAGPDSGGATTQAKAMVEDPV